VSLALDPVAHPPPGLHLRDLQRTWVLTEVLVVVGEVGCGLATKGWIQGKISEVARPRQCTSIFDSPFGGGGGDFPSSTSSRVGQVL
jgi:hypothetical protein